MPEQPATTYQAYYVTEPAVAVIGRNNRTGLQVWSADWGYPGDFDYREFHKKDGISGMQYWRVSGARVDLADKDAYHPDWAEGRVKEHAHHFARLVADLLQGYHGETGEFGIVSANYDTELFGHWWFEGIHWLELVLRHLAESESVELTTASDYILSHTPRTVIHLPEGSWGAGGGHFTWDNADTHWMWPIIHAAEQRMRGVVASNLDARGATRHVLDQAARELLLLQSSDWPFLVSTGQAAQYSIERFRTHVERFDNLVFSVEQGKPDRALAERLWEQDKVFPEIDFRWYQA
jgi:1,4-alpha-glucan branching enzyme